MNESEAKRLIYEWLRGREITEEERQEVIESFEDTTD